MAFSRFNGKVPCWFVPLVAAALVTGCGSPSGSFPALRPGVLNESAGLDLPTRERFEIGGPGSGAFSLLVQNRGAVPIRFSVRDAAGEEGPPVVLAPGRFLQPAIPAGATAVFQNPNRLRKAALLVRVDAETSPPMRLQPLR